jgi:hypothetical protein
MAFLDSFRPKWRHSSPSVRLSAVKALTDQAVLAQVAKTDPAPEVRDAAAERLTELRSAQNRRKRAILWWRGKGSSSKRCDICAGSVRPNEGYLLDTEEVVNSGPYIRYAASLRSVGTLGTMRVPGMDSVVMDVVSRAMNSLSEVALVSDIRKVTTPWLVCEQCLGKYFSNT